MPVRELPESLSEMVMAPVSEEVMRKRSVSSAVSISPESPPPPVVLMVIGVALL